VLLGFAQMNCAHNRSHLGQVLYKICNRLQVIHKVSIVRTQCLFAHSFHMSQHRLVILHATMPRTTTLCCKNLHAAISSRLGMILMSNTVKSGTRPLFCPCICTDFLTLLVHLGVSLISSISQLKLSSLRTANLGITMAILMTTTSPMI
jgi:hypothetical protein